MKKKTKLTWICEWSGREITNIEDGYVVAIPTNLQGGEGPKLFDPIVIHREEDSISRSRRWKWSQPLSYFTTRDKWQRLKMMVEDGLLTVDGATRLAAKLKITLYRPITEFLEADRGTWLGPKPLPPPRVSPEAFDFMADHSVP